MSQPQPQPPQFPDSFDEARPHLRPMLRGRWHIEMPRLQAQIEDAHYSGHLASMPFCQDAVVLVGYDFPDRIVQVPPEQLAIWKMTLQDAFKVAVQNLRAVSAPSFQALQGGVRVGDWQDGHDASRLLLPEVMRQCGIDDELIMMVPSRRAGVLVAPAGSVDAQLHMLGFARQIIEDRGGLISAAMFRYQDRRVSVHQPANAHLAAKLGELQKVAASALYAEQKDLLQALHRRQRKDLFVAGYQVAQCPGAWLSACSWTQGVTALLPKTDVVSMVTLDPRGGDQHQVKILDWDVMLSLAGDRLQPVDGLFPPRFMVTGFPPEDVLARAPAAKL